MRPLTEDTPKSLLPVAGQPILDHLLGALRDGTALGAIHIAVNHRDADHFRAWAADWRPTLQDDGIALHIHDDGVASTDEQRGAVGDLQFLLDRTGLPPDGALVSGGDSLYRFPLAPLLTAFDGTESQVLALHEPAPSRRRHSSILQLAGDRVQGLVDDPAATDSERICPSWHLLTSEALGAVAPYLDAGGDPDTLGGLVDAIAQKHPVRAIRLPEQPHLRLHCNTPADLKRARTLLDADPAPVLAPNTVRACCPA